jgi:hypothetical protein
VKSRLERWMVTAGAFALVATAGGTAGWAAGGVAAATPACAYASHPGQGGAQFRALTPQAQAAAVALCKAGILTGTAPNLFSPYVRVTRAQALKFVVLALGATLTSSQTATFSDVSVRSPYFKYVETAVKLGIIPGPMARAGGKLLPSQFIQRQEFAAVIVDALGDAAAARGLSGKATPYTDNAKIAPAYRGDVNEALALGLVPPYSRTTYNPTGSLERVGFARPVWRTR